MSYIRSIRSMSAFSEYEISTGGDGDDDKKSNVTCGDSVLDPSIWSDLPTAMVELIFAQLPLREVYRLRSLSRGWRSAIASPESEFMRLLAMVRKSFNKLVCNSEAFDAGHSKIIESPVAIWSGIVDANHFTFRVLDRIGASKFHESWCALTFTPPFEYLFSWFAHDGGLVCLFPDNHIRCWTLADNACDDENEKHANYKERLRGSTPLPLLVANPLTNVQKTLPLQNVVHEHPDMVQLRVDRDSGEYKVILVGQGLTLHGIDYGYAAEVYDSSTGTWSMLSFGYVFDYMFEQYLCGETRSAKIYDCERGECRKPLYSSPPNGVLLACTQFKGSYYELRRETMRNLQEAEGTLESTRNSKEEFTYTISQFQCDDSYRFRLKGRVEVADEEIPLDGCYHPSLLACNSFILLLADICPRYNVDDQEAPPRVMRLYNMALGKWVPIPQGRFEVETHNRTHNQDHMIELQWAVVP